MQEYLIGFEKSKQFLANCKYSCYLDIAALDSYDRRLQDALSRLNILKNTLSDICDIYEMYDKKVFVNYDMGNLYAEIPLHETTTFRLVVGTVVVVGSIALAVLCPPSAILSGAAIGSAMGAVTGGVIGGVTAVCHGENFLDGFADGYMWGSVSGAISGTLGAVAEGVMAAIGGVAAKTGAALAARAVVAVCDGAIDAGIYAGQTKANDGDVTVGGVATAWITGTVMSFAGQTVAAAWSKPAVKGGENVFESKIPRGGEEWNDYFIAKYGKNNVEWISNKPSGEDWRNLFIDKYGYSSVIWDKEELFETRVVVRLK